MRRRFAYDQGRHPPAPVLPLHVGSPESDEDVLVASLVDSGADCTLVPAAIVRRLALPFVGRLLLVGVGGQTRPAPVYAARVRLAGLSCLARVIAFDGEAIIGRDLLNRVTVLLDGPRLALSVR